MLKFRLKSFNKLVVNLTKMNVKCKIYNYFRIKSSIGVIIAVIIPTITKPNVLMTISFSLPFSMHFEVPII